MSFIKISFIAAAQERNTFCRDVTAIAGFAVILQTISCLAGLNTSVLTQQ